MGLLSRRSFLTLTGMTAAGAILTPSHSYSADNDWIFGRPSDSLKEVTFEAGIKDPKNIRLGQALVDKLAKDIFKDKAYDHVDNYIYDPKVELVVKDSIERLDRLANNPANFENVRKQLSDPEILEGTVKSIVGENSFVKLLGEKHKKKVRKMLQSKEGIRAYILADIEATKTSLKGGLEQAYGRTLLNDFMTGVATKSNVYIHQLNIDSDYKIATSRGKNGEKELFEFISKMNTPPLEETLRGVIVHEENHAKESHIGMDFQGYRRVVPAEYGLIDDDLKRALSESRANIAELQYLAQYNNSSENTVNYSMAYVSQSFFIRNLADEWMDVFTSERKTKLESEIAALQKDSLKQVVEQIKDPIVGMFNASMAALKGKAGCEVK